MDINHLIGPRDKNGKIMLDVIMSVYPYKVINPNAHRNTLLN